MEMVYKVDQKKEIRVRGPFFLTSGDWKLCVWGRTGNLTQGLTHARQTLPLSYIPSP